MTSLVFLRSIELEQTRPHFAQCREWLSGMGVEDLLLYSDGEVSREAYGGPATRVAGRGSLADFTEAFEAAAPKGSVGVSISIPDENVVRDAVLAGRQRRLGHTILAPSVTAAICFASKWETKHLLDLHGIPTPPGFYIDGDLIAGRSTVRMDYAAALDELSADTAFPIIVKPIWDCLGNGMVRLDSRDDFQAWLHEGGMGINCLAEEAVDGELCSVECISDGQRIVFQPVVWKGPALAEQNFAFEQVRWASSAVTLDDCAPDLASRIRGLMKNQGLVGAFEFEFIRTEAGLTCIEVNPRVSGSTAMSIAASGLNTYVELCKIALNRWSGVEPLPTTVTALQFPLLSGGTAQRVLERAPATVLRVSDFEVGERVYPSALVSVQEPELVQFYSWFRAAGVGVVSESTAAALGRILEERISLGAASSDSLRETSLV
jgi:hypothetical protein